MARVRAKSEEKRQQILCAAIDLFMDQGFDNTSMDRIAQHAGVSKQTVYSHFGNKEELFTASVSRRCIAAQLDPGALSNLGDAKTVLQEIARRFIDLVHSDGAVQVYRTCVAQLDTHPQLAKLFYEAGPKATLAGVARVFDEFVERGELKIENTDFAASQFLMMVQGEMKMRRELDLEPLSEARMQEYIQSSIALFLKGYAA